MKKDVFILVFVIVFSILSVSLVMSDFEEGKELYDIDLIYGPVQPIIGWVNISLDKEPTDSLLTGFDSSIELKEFLDKTDASYSCFPDDCASRYSSSGSGIGSKTFSINALKEKVLGIKLTGDITGINGLSFDVATNAGKSCLHPLKIDILDNGIDWKANEITNDFTCILSNNYGCWDEDDYSSNQDFIITSESKYCEKINVIAPTRVFEIGAEITQGSGGEAEIIMEMDIGEVKECTEIVNSEGEVSCSVEFDDALEENVQAEVCISVESSDNGKYKIKYESVSPCGFVGSGEYDFPIFVKPGKYEGVNDFTFNQDLIDDGNTGIELGPEIWGDYILNKYNGDCNPECVIPIKFYSGVSQTITISNLNLEYKRDGDLLETNIYEVTETPALISSDFQKLDLVDGNFLTPDDYGEEEFRLELDDEEIFEEDIKIKPVPGIKNLMPNIVPALVDIEFSVVLEDIGINLTYTWDFGDGSDEQITKTNKITHMYSEIGSYEAVIKVSNEYGEASKTFQLNAISPKDAIDDVIIEYKEDLKNIKAQINTLPSWVQTEIEKKFDVDNLNSSVNLQERKYEDAFDDEDYIKIMTSLLELKIPYSLNISQLINPMNFFPVKEELDLEALENLGAGTADETKEKYYNAINNWLQLNLDISLESKTYSFYYRDSKIEPLISYVKLVLEPKNDLDEVYLVVNGDPEKIQFRGIDTKDVEETAEAVIFSELIERETIEFLYPEGIDMQSFPIYISPELKYLDTGVVAGVCNSNKKCEKARGENYENCRTDCKPLGWTIFWLFALIFSAFIVYIVLQEWYKKHYESRLFTSKNQLFNLINFMNNSLNQGLKKSEVFEKLKPLGWVNEQLSYSWKKLHGKRTGMWEIPVFKWAEKKQVKKELSKRPNTPNLSGLKLK